MKSGIVRLLSLLLMTMTGGVFANGGPIDTSGFLGSGNIRLIREDDIALRSECLTIAPQGDWIEIHAVYTLENNGPAKLVEYGFPLEAAVNRMVEYYSSPDKEPTVRILDGSMPVPAIILTAESSVDASGMGSYMVDGETEWHIASLEFESGETKTVSVHCRILASYDDFSTTKNFLPSYSFRYFRYTLDPAGYWGCGIADEMEIAVDFSWITANGGAVDEITGPGTWLTDDIWSFSSENFMFDGTDPIEFQYSIDRWKLAGLFRDNFIPEWYFTRIEVSSELPDQGEYQYDYGNLFDSNPATAWVEGSAGDGTGEWIEVELPEAYHLGFIAVLNGYQSSREAYEANGRAAEISCTLFFTDGSTESRTVDLEDLTWDELSIDPCRGYQRIYDSGMPREVDRFRLEISDIYPGSIYSDMCISECIVLGNPCGIWPW